MSEASIVEPDITWLLVKVTLSAYAESMVSGRKRRGNGMLAKAGTYESGGRFTEIFAVRVKKSSIERC